MMNILFLTLTNISSIWQRGIYTDLSRVLSRDNNIYAISISSLSNVEKKNRFWTDENITVLEFNLNSARREENPLKKGLVTLFWGVRIKKRIKEQLKGVHFDFIIYATPPITYYHVVSYFKKRDHAKTYLLLKDIFPQNAVDLGMMKTTGLNGLIYSYFRRIEKKLYTISDRIGCMSQANVDYVLKHNPNIDPDTVDVCPNSIEVRNMNLSDEEKKVVRQKYGIPVDKKVFVYGGNLGKPQGIPFIIECFRAETNNENAFFLIVGNGTEYGKLETFINVEKPTNVMLMKRLPKEDYERMISACDIGMIFLDHRFTIPNFPSRMLSYMQARLPVIACTDPNTDIGKVITEGGFGWWCESDDVGAFAAAVEKAALSDLAIMGEKAFTYLNEHYTVEYAANIIMKENDS